MKTMQLTINSPEILRRDRSYKFAEAISERAMRAGNQRKAMRAARLMMALHTRMDNIVLSSVSTYRDNKLSREYLILRLKAQPGGLIYSRAQYYRRLVMSAIASNEPRDQIARRQVGKQGAAGSALALGHDRLGQALRWPLA